MTTELFNEEFKAVSAPMKSYLLRITASVQDVEDIVQDTYIKGLEKLGSFRGESSLKTWLFTIACNLAKDNLRAQKRWVENVTDICREEAMSHQGFFNEAMQIRATSPQGTFEIKEHITFCFTCISKSLPLEQQLCLFLKEIYEFKVSEIERILGVTEAMVKYYLHTGRAKMIGIFDNRCAIINKEGVCHQCSELNGVFNPKQKFQEEVVKIEMAREADKGDKEHLFDLRMKIIQNINPFESGAAELQLHHLEHNRNVMEKYV
ncbi:RNA polymerase subunit sigma-24 [Flavipsychrobacter stenotrophus]|uniref:RNA polymerase sigma factor n=1 Tax=Flavipsychrobacter stenotrophus TaxID=2077091 RepID=A0A2S7SZT1_9BACT|nr:RNA polymerase sigma factor [Flavipsychrobacter stenotrophus]PQJ12459.1 RNA polymerase subunit sigma-24 [Flavipsychrobacter stenotrophus]